MIYSDPQKGSLHGYNFDGWLDDEDVFLYTGDGQVGDQQLIGGNRAIYRHVEDGRALRVFVADGVIGGGSNAKRQLYLGEFTLDDTEPYFRAEAPGRDGVLRSAIVFRLRPAGAVWRRPADSSHAPASLRAGAEESVQPLAEFVPAEAYLRSRFATPGSAPAIAERRESELSERYRLHLETRGHQVGRYRVRLPGEPGPLFTDLFDATNGELAEIKGVGSRDAVRQAIGQLLDYARFVPARTLAVVLPSPPIEDLVSLLCEVGMTCVYESDGAFFRFDP